MGQGRSPRYALVAEQLIKAINNGKYAPGAMLPTERELCQRFDVSRITIRAALKELQLRGLVSSRAGVGTWVESVQSVERFVDASQSVDEWQRFTVDHRFQVLEHRTVTANAELAALLECNPGQTFERVTGLRVKPGGLPACHSVHYIPHVYADAIPHLSGMLGSIAGLLERNFREPIIETRQIFAAEILSPAKARVLKAKPRTAALVTRRWYLASGGKLLIYTISTFPMGRYVYTSRMRRERTPGIARKPAASRKT